MSPKDRPNGPTADPNKNPSNGPTEAPDKKPVRDSDKNLQKVLDKEAPKGLAKSHQNRPHKRTDDCDPREKRLHELMDVKVELDEQSRTDAANATKRHQLENQIEASKHHQLEVTKSSIYRQSLQVDDDPYTDSPMFKIISGICIVLCFASLVSLWVAIFHGWNAFLAPISFLTYQLRPYVVINLLAGFMIDFWIILKIRTLLPGLEAMPAHGNFSGRDRSRIERQVELLWKAEAVTVYLACVLGMSFFICSVGWENIFTALGGAKATFYVCWFVGTAVWMLLPSYFKK